MKIIRLVLAAGVMAAIGFAAISTRAAEGEGVAVAIIYDTSGSMREQVRDSNGKSTPKYVIANRALENIANRLQTFATNAASPRNIQAGLFIFDGNGSKAAVPFGPFDASAFRQFAQNFVAPTGNTPLGNALSHAGRTVLGSKLTRKHVLIITDGINTAGPAPAQVMPDLKQLAENKGTVMSVHFVAFDVDAKSFSAVKRLGATVVGAADEDQLKTQLEFIMEKKILLEDEEPAKQK